MKTFNGIEVVNCSGQPFGKAVHHLPEELEAEKFVLLPDLCPTRGPLPTGCVVKISRSKVPNWREYTLSDVGCGIALYRSELMFENFEKFKPEWDALAEDLRGRAGELGELGSGNHFLDAVVGEDEHIYFAIHTGSRDEGEKLEKLLNSPRQFDEQYNETIKWARKNRKEIAKFLEKRVSGFSPVVDKPHNLYVKNDDEVIIRKGAVKIKPDEQALIPSTMDGDMILVKAREEIENLLNSISHGTGRVMSRGDAKKVARNYDFEALRRRIYIPPSIPDQSLRTENPSCYRNLDECLQLIDDYVEERQRLTPIAYIGQV